MARTFSKIRGAPPMNVGLITPRFSTIRVRSPSTAVLKPSSSWTAESTLPSTWDSGSHRYCTSSGAQDAEGRDRGPSYIQLSWTRRTPLGRPVVPEV